MALYDEKDVDLVRTLEAVVCAEMLACLDHLVVLELVRIRLLACLPLTETYERANQESTRLQVSAIGSKVASHCEKKMTGWLFTRCTRSSYSSTVVRRLASRACSCETIFRAVEVEQRVCLEREQVPELGVLHASHRRGCHTVDREEQLDQKGWPEHELSL